MAVRTASTCTGRTCARWARASSGCTRCACGASARGTATVSVPPSPDGGRNEGGGGCARRRVRGGAPALHRDGAREPHPGDCHDQRVEPPLDRGATGAGDVPLEPAAARSRGGVTSGAPSALARRGADREARASSPLYPTRSGGASGAPRSVDEQREELVVLDATEEIREVEL